ncbi:MAG: NAD-dependent epimerase/dehydratase family protein [Proteobacteria bacterium]|nr:NAD-dependent epimerase/dehydratase family protein [Pseudomonadota bacterium]
MTRVLVTGGAGFIGSHIARHWKERGAQVAVLDDFRTGHRANVEGEGIEVFEGSILDRALVTRAAEGVDYVFHLAAMVSVVESMQDPARCVDVNVHGTLNVLEAARRAGARKVVLSSTAAVYGNEEGGLCGEGMPVRPISPYGITKLDGELYLEMYRREHGLQTVSLRYFNVFGPRQDTRSPYSAVIPTFIERALRGDDLIVHGDGSQTRDFVYVGDAVAANVLAAETPDLVGPCNVGHGRATSVVDLARVVLALVDSRSRIVHAPSRAGDIAHSTADISRLRAFGFSCATSLEDGLRATVDWYRTLPLPGVSV